MNAQPTPASAFPHTPAPNPVAIDLSAAEARRATLLARRAERAADDRRREVALAAWPVLTEQRRTLHGGRRCTGPNPYYAHAVQDRRGRHVDLCARCSDMFEDMLMHAAERLHPLMNTTRFRMSVVNSWVDATRRRDGARVGAQRIGRSVIERRSLASFERWEREVLVQFLFWLASDDAEGRYGIPYERFADRVPEFGVDDGVILNSGALADRFAELLERLRAADARFAATFDDALARRPAPIAHPTLWQYRAAAPDTANDFDLLDDALTEFDATLARFGISHRGMR